MKTLQTLHLGTWWVWEGKLWKKSPPTAGRYRFCWVSQGPREQVSQFPFSNVFWGRTPIRPSLLLSWVSSDRPPSLTLVWIRAWNTVENSQIQLGLCWISALCWVSQGPQEQVSQFPFLQACDFSRFSWVSNEKVNLLWLLQIRWALIPRIYIGGGGATGTNSSKLVKTQIPYIFVQKYMLNHSNININKTSKMHQIVPF